MTSRWHLHCLAASAICSVAPSDSAVNAFLFSQAEERLSRAHKDCDNPCPVGSRVEGRGPLSCTMSSAKSHTNRRTPHCGESM
nr:MAG TPA: hypothetical protein [Caudoviricetes sp.]